jgi:hypothetical protein
MSFIRLWFSGYHHPAKMMEELGSKPAPHWGFFGQLLRAALDSLLLYFPLALIGRVPPMRSFLPLFPTEKYYWHLIRLSPMVLAAQWLLPAAFNQVVLRFTGRRSDFDQLLNIGGMTALVVGAFLFLWDWTIVLIGGSNQYLLGFSHLVISLYGVALGAIGMKKILGVPTWLGVILGLLTILIALPFGIMFMRSPV